MSLDFFFFFSPNHCFVLNFNYLFLLFLYFTAIMRSFSLLQEAIIPYIPTLITQLTQKLLAVSKVTRPVLKVQLLFNLWSKLFEPQNSLAAGQA